MNVWTRGVSIVCCLLCVIGDMVTLGIHSLNRLSYISSIFIGTLVPVGSSTFFLYTLCDGGSMKNEYASAGE